MAMSEHAPSAGFPPIAAVDARILILGSLPGQRSLRATEYYAHKQNAFWRIMEELFNISGTYASCCEQLTENGIALWDVLASSVRPGSLDSDIRVDSATANDFSSFLSKHADIERICFNGKKSEQLFRKLVLPDIDTEHLTLVSLPSTSPAYAALPFAGKLDFWSAALAPTHPREGN